MIRRHFFDHLGSIMLNISLLFKDNKVANDIQKTLMRKHTLDQHVEIVVFGARLAVNTLPSHKSLLISRDSADAPIFHMIRNDAQLVVGKE